MADDFDLDEALLQVAGAGKGKSADKKRSRRGRVSDDDDQSIDFGSEDERQRDNDSNKRRKGAKPSSRRTAASESEDEDADDADRSLYEDEADRKRLEAMTELEREMILAERAEALDKERQRKQLLRSQKSKANDQSVEPSRSTRRARQQTEADTAIRKLAAARERKEADIHARQKAEEAERARAASSDEEDEEADAVSTEEEEEADSLSLEEEEEAGSEVEAEEEVEAAKTEHRSYDRDRGATASLVHASSKYPDDDDEPVDEGDEEADYDDVKKMQVPRGKLESWMSMPAEIREKYLLNSVVRVPIGSSRDPVTGDTVPSYRFMQVIGFKDGSVDYTFGTNGDLRIRRLLVVRDGAKEYKVQFKVVSNSPVTLDEFRTFQDKMKNSGKHQLKRMEVSMVVDNLKAADTWRFTSEEVQRMVREKRDRSATINFAAEKAKLMVLRETASTSELPEIDEKLRRLEEQRKASAESKSNSRGFGMFHINQRNKLANFMRTFNNVSNRSETEKDKGGVDIFSRRHTRPKVYWNTKSAAARELDREVAAKAAEAAAMAKEAAKSQKLTKRQQRMDQAELLKCLDIDIDTSLLVSEPTAPMPKRLLGVKWMQALMHHNSDLSGKTPLSIADWRRRAGIS